MRGSQLDRGFVIGGYRIDELISRGGMGVVYRATNIALNRIYALKVMAPELAGDPAFRERFSREMRIAASITHPNVVAIHYAGEQNDLVFFVMDFIVGTDLREVLRKTGAIEPERAVDLLSQCASALDAAHAKGLVHRDVKPANILITVHDGEEHAYLTDFGVAKRSDTAAGLTAQGAVVGTVDYMSPEQITGEPTDARTDVYALGCVFFQMLTGDVPYDRENSIVKLFAHVHEEPPTPQGSLTDVYPALVPVLAKAMAKEPGDRYLSAGDFARDAAAALRGARYTGPSTVVGIGEARPSDAGETPATEPPLLEPSLPEPPLLEPPLPEPPLPEPPLLEPRDADLERTSAAGAIPYVSPVTPSPAAAAAPAPPSGSGSPSSVMDAQPPAPPSRGALWRYRWAGAGALVVIAAAVIAVVLSSGSGSGVQGGLRFAANPGPVPTNRVTGSGTATVALKGDEATVRLDTHGLLNGAAHAMHIHAGGVGECPPASAAHLHNGHLSISTTDGIHFYGPPEVSLTSHGDTTPASIVDFSRYPSTGNIEYTRTVKVPMGVADALRAGNAVIVVHGIDYNGNHIYDNVLDRSELNNSLPGEATAPALCGPLSATKSAAVPGGPLYASASLRPYVPSPGEQRPNFWLLCQLA